MRNKRAEIRFSEEEYDIIKDKASRHGLTISSFLRNLALNYPLKNITDVQSANKLFLSLGELRKVGGLLKLLLEEAKKNGDTELRIKLIKELEELKETQHIMKVQAFSIIDARKK